MKYLKHTHWEKLPLPKDDYRPRFFIELYQELLNSNTPSSYQPRIMSLSSYINEIIDLIKHYEKDERAKPYIHRSVMEFITYLKDDNIAREIYTNEIWILENHFDKKDNYNNREINKLTLIMNLFLDKEKQDLYWIKICDNLNESICDNNYNYNNIKRNLEKINKACKLFSSYLLNKGMSNRYLFNRAEKFINLSNYRERDFNEQLIKVTNDFNEKEKTFTIHFLIKSNRIIENKEIRIITYDKFINTNSKLNNDKKFNSFINQKNDEKSIFYVLTFNEISSNYDNALLKAKEELAILDTINILHKIEILQKALIIEEKSNKYHTNLSEIDIYLDNASLLDISEININSILDKLDHKNIEIIRNSLRYFRLAKESKSIEQKILNTWIAIESLYIRKKNDMNSSIIENIIHYVPMIYNSMSIIRKIRYAKKLLSINKIYINDEIKKELNIKHNSFNNLISDEKILIIMRNNKLFKSLVRDNNLKDLEHLKYRLTTIYDLLKNGKKDKEDGEDGENDNIDKIFSKSKLSIENQIYRIYFMRNKISHQGYYKNINSIVFNHLTDYLMISYSAIVVGAKYLPKMKENEKFSILDILDSYELQFHRVLKNIKEDKIDTIASIQI